MSDEQYPSRPQRRRWGRLAFWGLAAWVAGGLAVGVALASQRQAAPGDGPGGAGGGDLHDHAAHGHAPGDGSGGHEEEGLRLVPAAAETVSTGAGCDEASPLREYEIVALGVDMTLNRYGDHDPDGRMYALASEVERVRAEDAANERARAGRGEFAVSAGLQGDAIQPLALRVLPGECLRLHLRNDLDGEPASLHLHGSTLVVTETGEAATAANPDATVAPGGSVSYEWAVPADEPEGTHYFHSHGDEREQTSHGLFGAVIVEPRGSTWTDPLTGEPTETGWQAIVRTDDGRTFREYAIFYHEIGHENVLLLDREGEFVPQVDPTTGAYRPAARALNYRSEPFLNRLSLQELLEGFADDSMPYSSYAFGDPATPLMRSYVGDPVKQRVIHGGSEVSHVHHVHGGSIRWRRQPGAEPDAFGAGLDKRPALTPAASERTDSQSLLPAETFDVAPECGSGGCQQGAGDFMYHCHIAHHYFSGMWGVWRVYNTLQDGSASTDGLPPLLELPDRDAPAPAVASDGLLGVAVPDGAALADLVEAQLPPRGVPRGYDASVWDWAREGDRYLGEPEDERVWPGYSSATPGERPALLFDPRSGRLAYPFMRPHLGRRPPFAPGHGPAGFLDDRADAPVCPSGANPRTYEINAIEAPIPVNDEDRLVDPNGQLFVLRSEADRVRAEGRMRVPLALRANAQEDCVDVLLRSELVDDAAMPFSKVGVHIHFVQFDVQGSDGISVGFNYEQTVRPYRAQGEELSAPAAAGSTTVTLRDAARFQAGALLGIGLDRDEEFEVRRIVAVAGRTVRLDAPLEHAHEPGEIAGTEFVRYRWYPDAQFGTAYFHDHVDGIESWRHGLFGALVAEPPGSTWTDPRTGEPLASGPIADVHTEGRPGIDAEGSFRELLLFSQDDQPLTHVGRSDGGSYNLRAEPLDGRDGDPALRFSSREHGDPETPLLEAEVGDPIVVRNLVGGTNEVTTWHLDGHWFRVEPWSATSPPVNTVRHGISERYDVVVPGAGGPQRRAGDYLYYSGRAPKLAEGAWGILRVHGPGAAPGLRPLPGREPVEPGAGPVCPAGAPVRAFDVHVVEVPLPGLDAAPGKVYVLAADRDAVLSGAREPEPLVIYATVGDCVRVALANETDGAVSLHPDLLAFDPADSAGVAAGNEPAQVAEPGGRRTYTWYASPEIGETVALLRDWGDVLANPALGLYGTVVVGEEGTVFRDPLSGESLEGRASWRADVFPPAGDPYRSFTLFLHDEDDAIGSHRMPYTREVRGAAAVNYRAEPLGRRSLAEAIADGPSTPVLETIAGDPVRVNVVLPWSAQNQSFSIEGHRWPSEPGLPGTPLAGALQVGGLEALTLRLDGGAGGPAAAPGDYVYGNHRLPYREAGQWGILRVHDPAGDADGRPRPLAERAGLGTGGIDWPLWALAALGVAVAGAVAGTRRRRLRRTLRP